MTSARMLELCDLVGGAFDRRCRLSVPTALAGVSGLIMIGGNLYALWKG